MFSLVTWGAVYPDSYRYQILVTDQTSSTVTAQSFVTIPQKVVSHFSKELEQHNFKVTITSDWVKPFFTAWANKTGDQEYSVNFWGGLARIPGMSDEGFALTACHELGHILGGTPKIKIKEFLWSSSEGQSDYFATRYCLKRYFDSRPLNIPDVSGTSYTICRTTFSESSDFNTCLQSMKGIESFSHLLSHLSQYELHPSVETPSRNEVQETVYDSYPDAQCRIDTLVMGALNKPRPLCWFRQ